MARPGLAAFERRDAERTRQYSYERENARLEPRFERKLRANRAAWSFFSAQSPSYRKLVSHWVMSAKREETRVRRLETLMRDCAAGVRIGPLRRPGE
jgi:uncharacterized protein YdeI (YjbR/CyaY-like superfamily)